MNLLEIVQTLHRECELPGTVPDAVTGQTGRAADLVRWAIEAYNDIQRENDGRWRWLHKPQIIQMADGAAGYRPSDLGSTFDGRFRAWDQTWLPIIYLTSDATTRRRIRRFLGAKDFSLKYYTANLTPRGFPAELAVYPDNTVYLGPRPQSGDAYTVGPYFWLSNQNLAADDDEPEMPADFHMLIVFRAMVKYGYNVVAPEKLARARADGGAIMESLDLDQGWAKYTFEKAGPLA